MLVPQFSKFARPLRQEFEQIFGDPNSLDPRRFCWDPWYVPDQYSQLRTPAYHFFSPKLYAKFHRELVLWGRRNLGCWDVSPPMLSLCLHGHFQNFHCDVPHGPWAFVLPLQNYPQFEGGETCILKTSTLSFWNSDWSHRVFESGELMDRVRPEFNRLLVFDPRFPHAVSPVHGPRDPLQGRLVIHGWFSKPEAFVEGGLRNRSIDSRLNQALKEVQTLLGSEILRGSCALQLHISSSGQVRQCRWISSNLRDEAGRTPSALLQSIKEVYGALSFPKASSASRLLLPLIFDV